jgi:hypothetical protein
MAASVSPMTVHRILRKRTQASHPEYWNIPPKESAAFVARMEDMLAIYEMPYDYDYPVICMDESCKQLIGDVQEPMACALGRPARVDHEYVRNGVAEIFLEAEPLTGRRHVEATSTGPGRTGHVGSKACSTNAIRTPKSAPGYGQPQYPLSCFPPRGVSSGRSPTVGRASRHPLHTQARQLA